MNHVWDVFNTQPEFKDGTFLVKNSQIVSIMLCLYENQPCIFLKKGI